MARYNVAPSRLGRYYFFECDRFLRYDATPRDRRAAEGVPVRPTGATRTPPQTSTTDGWPSTAPQDGLTLSPGREGTGQDVPIKQATEAVWGYRGGRNILLRVTPPDAARSASVTVTIYPLPLP